MLSRLKKLQCSLDAFKLSWFIPILAVCLYANTITHEYTQDDAIVIYDNIYTTQGIKGIPELLKYDTFRGFFKTEGKSKLVSGGRYRPLTPIMFAIEYHFFGLNPLIGHLINILLYAFLGLILFWVLNSILSPLLTEEASGWIALFAALFYIAHPIHTEVVANIKGRDEIVAMIGCLSSIWMGLKFLQTRNRILLLGAFSCFLIGLFSKENTITYLAILPLIGILFKKNQFKTLLYPWFAMILATILFLIIRTSILGLDLGGSPIELMNNPFLKWDGNEYVSFTIVEKMATIFYTLGNYVYLLIFPHPLTHDYYPLHIEMMSLGDISVIASIILYLFIFCIAFFCRKNPIVSFCAAYYIITLSIVSNIIFPIGTNMSERFLFMPSLGYCLILSWFLLFKIRGRLGKRLSIITISIILCLYSIKTVSRNMVWKNDFTLFTTDVKTSKRSAKVLNAAGGALVSKAQKLADSNKKEEMLNEAIGYLNKAMNIHPLYKNPPLILGNAYYYLGKHDEAIQSYQKALDIAPEYEEAQNNLAIVLRDIGRIAGEKEQNIDKALKYLEQSYQLNKEDVETIRLLGVANGIAGNHNIAITYFSSVVSLAPSKESYENLGTAYMNTRDTINATKFYNLAKTFSNLEK